MSELTPSVLSLDKGLDLQTAKITAPPGSVFDSLNYEQVDFQGQKRIEGYSRYDGSLVAAVDDFYVLDFTSDGETSLMQNRLLFLDGKLFGKVVDSQVGQLTFASLNDTVVPEQGDILQIYDGNSIVPVYTVTNVRALRDTGITADDYYSLVLDYNDVLRSETEELPGPVIGLHWFRDRLYSVADMSVIEVTGNSVIPYPNDLVTVDSGPYIRVLDAVRTERNTYMIFLATTTHYEPEGQSVSNQSGSIGTLVEVGALPEGMEMNATIFESRTEQQVQDEDTSPDYDFGWRAKHLGWSVKFENGLSLFGDLVAVNQNREDVGVQGPTSTGGTDGAPLNLIQKINLQGAPDQVNGWKSSDTPTNYTLDPSDVRAVDAKYTYADAFVSWATDGTVTPPSLVEYPATNTVTVEV